MKDWFTQYSEMVRDYSDRKDYHDSRRMAGKTVYCITEGKGMPCKIGLSQDPKRRFSLIASHTWRKLYVCWTAEGSPLHESGLKFVTRDIVLHGEWLLDPDDKIKAALGHDAPEADLRTLINSLADRFCISPTRPDRQPRKPAIDLGKLFFGRVSS